jgi:hypothetical protein
MIENLLFFLSRLESGNTKLVGDLLKEIDERKLVEKLETKNHLLLLSVESEYDIKIDGLNKQIEDEFIR